MGDWALVAELTKAKTLKGGLVARSVAGLPFLLEPGLEVAFVPPQHDAPRRGVVESVSEGAKGAHIVVFEGVADADTANRLAGCFCLVRRADLPEDAFVYDDDDLAGFEVHDAQAGFVGTVEGIVDNPGQSLLSVERGPGAAPALIPLVDELIAGIDEDARRIDVRLPAGLLDL